MRRIFLCTVAALAVAQSVSAQLLLRYNYDEASSGNQDAQDLSGFAPLANGTFSGSATRTTNTPNSAGVAALDLTLGAPRYVTPGDADKLDGLQQLTLTSWINLAGSPANGNRIMAKQNASSPVFDGFSFAFSNPSGGAGAISASNFQINLALGGTNGFAFNTDGVDFGANNTCVFVAVTYDGTQATGNLQFYSGGVATSVTTLGTPKDANAGALLANANEFRVGASSAAATGAPIRIDDTRVYNGVLTQTQLDTVRLENLPEPAAAALLMVALPALLARRRRTTGYPARRS